MKLFTHMAFLSRRITQLHNAQIQKELNRRNRLGLRRSQVIDMQKARAERYGLSTRDAPATGEFNNYPDAG